MRIIIINGSPRVSGITATTLHMLEKELVNNGMEVGFYNLSEIEMSQVGRQIDKSHSRKEDLSDSEHYTFHSIKSGHQTVCKAERKAISGCYR